MLKTGIYITMLLLSFGIGMKQPPTVLRPIRRFTCDQGGILNATFGLTGQIVIQSQKIIYPFPLGSRPSVAYRYLGIYGIEESAWLHSVQTGTEGEVADANFIGDGCSKIVYVKETSSLVVCEGSHTVRIRNASTLDIKSVISLNPAIRSADLVVAEREHVIYVVGVGQNGNLIMSSYSSATSLLLNTTEVSRSFRYPEVSLAISDDNQNLAMAVRDTNRRTAGAVIICKAANQSLTCENLLVGQEYSQTAFLSDDSLLFVSSAFATSHSSDCVQMLQLTTGNINRQAFCGKRGGVHDSLGILRNDRVVAFTGYARENWLTENVTAITNTASVWDTESRQIIAVTGGNDDAGTDLIRIVVDTRGSGQFVMFRRFINYVLLYELLR